MKHVMLDLETMGTKPGSAIVQIGAVEFDMAGNLGREFKRSIGLTSCLEAGLTVDGDTISWWLQQDDAARNSLLVKCVTIRQALEEFAEWLTGVKARYVWGNGSNFDNVLLTEAYTRLQILRPWHYRGDRDIRTLVWLAEGLGMKLDNLVEYEGVKHDALVDAKNQARFVQAVILKMKEMI